MSDITQDAIDNFSALTGCTVVRRSGRYFIKQGTRRLFFVKKTSHMKRWMELYERSQATPRFIQLNHWGSRRWSSLARYKGPTKWPAPNKRVLYGADFTKIEARVMAQQNSQMRTWLDEYSPSIQDHITDAVAYGTSIYDPFSAPNRRAVLGYAGRHGVSTVRAFVMGAVGSRCQEELRGVDGYLQHGAHVARGDTPSIERAAETGVNRGLQAPTPAKPEAPALGLALVGFTWHELPSPQRQRDGLPTR